MQHPLQLQLQVAKKTKWKIAIEALSTVLTTYEASAEFGLMVFPFPDECGPGRVRVSPKLNAAQAIMEKLAAPPPPAGNWTPMAQSLDAAARLAALKERTKSNHVLLITDGWQWCAPYDLSTRFAPVVSVRKLRKLGVRTHVVGFGAAVDALTLNKMAQTAGTKVSSDCKAASSNAASKKNCYFQANDEQQLLGALQEIVRRGDAILRRRRGMDALRRQRL